MKNTLKIFKIFTYDYIKKYNLNANDFVKGLSIQPNDNILDVFDILSITQQNIVAEVTEKFFKTGIDYCGTISKKANISYLNDYQIQEFAYDINFNAAKICHEIALKYTTLNIRQKRFAVGEIQFNLHVDPKIYLEQCKSLLSGKIDLLYLSNINDWKFFKEFLQILNQLMTKRNKKLEIVLLFDSDELAKFYDSIRPTFSNLIFTAFGISYNISQLTNIKNYTYDYINISNDKQFDIETLTNFINQTPNLKLLGLQDGFSLDNIETIVKSLK